MIGTCHHHPSFTSRFVEPRNVDVWLPPAYTPNRPERFPVLYFHDGQNLFDPHLSYAGVDWDIDGAMIRLINEGKIRPAIVVGIWNTPRRTREYLPARAAQQFVDPGRASQYLAELGGDLLSDEYLKFITPPPVALFQASTPTCSNTPVFFTDLSTLSSGQFSSWYWDFGDGSDTLINAPGNPDISHIYTTAGTYSVTLKVTTSSGCEAEYPGTITIATSPLADFIYDHTCANETVNFTSQAIPNGGTSLS